MIKKCGTNSIRQIYNKSFFSFMDYNVKKKSRKRLYIIIDKFRSRGHWKEATSNFAYVLKYCWYFPGGPVAMTPSSQCRGARVQSLVREIDPICRN